MKQLPNNLTVAINRINNNVISDLKDINNPMLPYFLVNGRAFYDNLFMPAMMDEVKANKRGNNKASEAKNIQEIINVSTIKKLGTTINKPFTE